MSKKAPSAKQTVEALEIEARYFRAHFEKMFYFIKAQEIGPEYDTLVNKVQKSQEAPMPEPNGQEEIIAESQPTTEDGNTEG